MDIKEFRGEYFFLSNFYEAPVRYDGIKFLNNESAFQAMKCENREDRLNFAMLDPSSAKRKGRRVQLRKDWEDIKEQCMYDIVLAKFSQNHDLKTRLLATKNAYLEEGNTWGDREWGTVNGVGKNKLGKILMRVREVLKEESVEEKNNDTRKISRNGEISE